MVHHVFDLKGNKRGKVVLPEVFGLEVRSDLIKRAVTAARSHSFQPKGVDLMAGKRTSAKFLGVGQGLSRIPRVKAGPLSGTGAFAPGTVGGRRAHPPKVEKVVHKKINKKERRKAVMHALAATASRELVAKRGHDITDVQQIPLIVENSLESLSKAKEAKEVFSSLGLLNDLERASSVHIRAGRGKMRGRRYKKRKSFLIVIGEDKGIKKAASNFPGVDVATVKELGAELLAPGALPGRLAIYTENAIAEIGKKYE